MGRWQLFARNGTWFMSIEENMKRGRGLSFFKHNDLDVFFFCSSFCLLDRFRGGRMPLMVFLDGRFTMVRYPLQL